MILLIDNYDSFVYNLARYVRELGDVPVVRRHDAISIAEITALAPSHIVISPGPCSPKEAGISTDVVRRLGPTIPILGVCLGHQCIGEAYGGEIVRARRPMHGKTSHVTHTGAGLFAGLPNPFVATRYHSLVIAPGSVPPELRVTATSEDGEIMAVEHVEHPVVGVQFHPESVLTEHGYRILERFLRGDRARNDGVPAGADGRALSAIRYPLSASPEPDGGDRRRHPRAHEAPWYRSGSEQRIADSG
jgi:anthranilate synthase/aminodeoxychorismate synthase-like glutamine amidotransferase